MTNQCETYTHMFQSIWITKAALGSCFDNLDKGWSVPGPDSSDILILRCLIDAARKIQRDMQRKSLIFLITLESKWHLV